MRSNSGIQLHNKLAPYWAFILFLLGFIGVSTIWLELGSFWKGYVLDITGPAWNYILFRGLFTTYSENVWTNFFTPLRTVVLFILVCLVIEGMQYFEIYDATYDPWDLVAYISLLVPLFIIDLKLSGNNGLA